MNQAVKETSVLDDDALLNCDIEVICCSLCIPGFQVIDQDVLASFQVAGLLTIPPRNLQPISTTVGTHAL
jgi:hypothetical protein